MKKVIWICVFCMFSFGELALAANSIEFWWVQHRKYEDGRETNKAAFAMKDASGNFITEDILGSFDLYDPNGVKIEVTSKGFGGTYQTVSGGYDANNGWWYFDDTLSQESYYYINFTGTLIEGSYRLVATDTSDIDYEAHKTFNGVHEIPVISSDTFCAFKDGDGNLIWKWGVPSEKFPSVSTSVRTYVSAYKADDTYIGDPYIKVPTHMGWAFLPANLLQQFEQAGGITFKIVVQIRTNDNNNRTYSSSVNWQEANNCGCDINGDFRTGLAEAIHALQVVSDAR